MIASSLLMQASLPVLASAVSIADVRERIDAVWQGTPCAHLDEVRAHSIGNQRFWGALKLPLLRELTGVLIEELIRDGRQPQELVALVGAHGVFDPYSMETLIELGLQVVSQDWDHVQGHMLHSSPLLQAALERGQFRLAPVEEPCQSPRADRPYELRFWAHPYLGINGIDQDMASGGFVVMQVDLREYLDDLASRHTEIFRCPVNRGHYLFPSNTYLTESGSEVGVYRVL